MEKITVRTQFHTAHRQPGYSGHCQYIHGHTWRAQLSVTCEDFPRDELDMSLDFGDLKQIARFLDHKIVVTKDDAQLLDPKAFDPVGIVSIEGKGPSVENIAHYCLNGIADHIRSKFPGRGIAYLIEVDIQETDNNQFLVVKSVTI